MPLMRLLRFIAGLLLGICLTACDTPVPSETEIDVAVGQVAAERPNELPVAEEPAKQVGEGVAQMWSRSCALCHVTGIGGAPRIGNVAEWQPRLAQGKDVLLAHTIEGFNAMPPLGYCMACERADFIAMIDFMLGEM